MSNRRSTGAAGFLLAAALCVGVSLDTSWRVFGDVLGIVGWERVLVFSALEVAFVACAVAMRDNVRQHGTPGPTRVLVWALAALASYFAVIIAGPVGGSIRAAVVLAGVVFLHHALGIEIRAQGLRQHTGTLARVGRELRERALSRLGLADDERDALTRSRERAARRAARLALSSRALGRNARLSRALRAARVGTDENARSLMLAELAVLRHGRALGELDLPAPWAIERSPVAQVSSDAPTTPGPADSSASAHRSASHARGSTRASAGEDSSAQPLSETTYANGVLDGATLAADTPPPWSGISKSEAVRRADALLPGRSTRQLAAALAQVGLDVPESSIRRVRTADRKGVDQPEPSSNRK